MAASTLKELIAGSLKGRRRNDVAKAIGVHRNALYHWTVGVRVPRLSHLRALAKELKWTDAQLARAVALAAEPRPSSAA